MATQAQAAAAATSNADGVPAEGTPAEGEAVEGAAAEQAAAAPVVEEGAAAAEGKGTMPDGQPVVVVPEKYELKLPKDSLMDASVLDEIATQARERGLSNEAAQQLVDEQSGAVANYHEAQLQKVEDTRKEWGETAAADKEIGGDAFKENTELAKRVIDRFGSDDLKKSLDDTGLGNHPEMLRIFVKIGRSMSDDQLVVPKAQGGENEKSTADTMYEKVSG